MTETIDGFDAGSAVPPLSYDFSAFGGKPKTTIPEPSTEQVASYWAEYVGMISRAQGVGNEAAAKREDETDEERDERIKAQIIEGQHRSTATVSRRREILAELCTRQPDVAELEALPYRLLDAFESYMMRSIRPEV